jgi:hypothetical protein
MFFGYATSRSSIDTNKFISIGGGSGTAEASSFTTRISKYPLHELASKPNIMVVPVRPLPDGEYGTLLSLN